jgi:hypothetical protein
MVKNKLIKQLIRVSFVLVIQMLTTYFVSYKMNTQWNLIKFFSDKLFITFWGTYIIVTLLLLISVNLYKKHF